MLKLVQDKLALQALVITLQGLQVTILKIKMVAAKLTASQHRMTNVKSGTSLLSHVHLTRSSRNSSSCAVTAVQKTFSLTSAEIQRIKEADAAKEVERHTDARTTYSRTSNTDLYFNVSIRDGIIPSTWLPFSMVTKKRSSLLRKQLWNSDLGQELIVPYHLPQQPGTD
ncbi:hypothetical protein K438DRAFT_1768356 [Mycena galopus ATCC 62051]|nr:hypothetical protein K438DRAFT_1768356 [Mycena galopus ATCC 62051]